VKIWVNEELVDGAGAYLDGSGWPHDAGLFETMRTEGGRVQLLARHMRRVITRAKILEIPIPHEDVIFDAVEELLENEPHEIGRLRFTFSKNRFIATHQKYLDQSEAFRVATHSVSDHQPGRRDKSYPYTSNLLLLENAAKSGFEELIVIGGDGRVAEGATSNYAFRVNGQWLTPPMSAGLLPGVIRALAVEECGISVRDIHQEDLGRCDAAIIMSSLKIARPVSSIDGKSLAIDSDVELICSQLRHLATTL
jgi:branched-chain amino acid aminotransferase